MGCWPHVHQSQAAAPLEAFRELLPAGPAGSARTWSVWLLYPHAGHSWLAVMHGKKGQGSTGTRQWVLCEAHKQLNTPYVITQLFLHETAPWTK
jgi:hypothetical protein